MPYPVSPPALPPVVNISSESSDRSSVDLHIAQTHSTQAGSDAFNHPPDCSEEYCDQHGLDLPTAPLEASLPTAEALGTPLSVGLSGGLSGSFGSSADLPQFEASLPSEGSAISAARSAPRFTTFLQVPDLEALVQARTSQPSRSTARNDANALSSNADRPADRSTVNDRVAGTQNEQPVAQTLPLNQEDLNQEEDVNQDTIELQDSIRLDLPIPEPESPEPDEPEDSPDTNPSQPQIEPFDGDPTLDDGGSSVPTPIPAPGGQILTIPTPRTRSDDPDGESPDPDEPDATAPPAGSPTPDSPPANGTSIPIDPQAVGEVLEVTADRQEFDERQQAFRADGNVVIRFRQGILTANRVRVNIPNRVAVAEGNAVLTRGEQVLRGERFTYNFGLNQGSIQTARGELFIPATQRDFEPAPSTDVSTADLSQPITQRVSAAQPLQVQGGVPGPAFGFGNRSLQGGTVNRLRFEADQVEFMGDSLVAQGVRITNDPFSPPELELRSSRVTYNRLSPTRAEIRARNPRLVFDQGFSLPLLVNRLVLDNRQRNSGLLSFGFDEDDRDGFYIERSFDVYSSPQVYFSLTPQLLVQRAIEQGGFPDPNQFGLVGNLNLQITPTTTADAVANLSSLDFGEIGDNLRASVRLRQLVFNHTVALDYSYRDRLFNGSLGFQDIQSSVGLVVFSPRYVLGTSAINLNYQGSVQYINAQTDQRELLPLDRTNEDILPEEFLPLDPNRDLSCIDPEDRDTTGNGCADLTRYQAAATLSRFFPLWVGTALPPTPTEGLRYTPAPVVPYVGVSLETRGVFSAYSNGDTQASLRGGVVLLGQFGNFSKPFFDYTAFVLGYFNTLRSGESPFLFDRISDEQFVVASITQQIYGPLRFGVQLSYNLDTSDEIDTVYSLEYSRRTYSVSATYSTGRQSATLTLRLNDFNWTGDPGPFSGLGSSTVEGGVIRNSN